MYYLVGGSGIPNFGDELMAQGWLRYLREFFPEERVILECAIPSVSTLMLQPENWRASHVSLIKSLVERNPQPDFWDNVERGFDFFDRGGFKHYPRLQYIERFLEETRVYHMFGGGYINHKWPQTGFLLGLAGAMKKTFQSRVVATGLGLMPISPAKGRHLRIFKTIVESFDLLEVRDTDSFDFIKVHAGEAPNVHAGLDDCFLQPIRHRTEGEPTLHLSCFLSETTLEGFAQVLQSKREEIGRRFGRILFWNCAPHRDAHAQAALLKVFPEMQVAKVEDLIQALPIAKGDAMIASRFHPHLMAARAGATGYFQLVSGRYYGSKHGSVSALGSDLRNFDAFGLDELFPSPSGRMARLDAERVAAKRAVAATIYR